MTSLRQRVLVSALIVLLVFVVLTSLALERAFRDSARSAREERLLGQIYLLMGAAEEVDDTLTLPKDLTEPRFSYPDSGLYAAVLDEAGQAVWRSGSTVTAMPPLGGTLPAGQRRFDLRRGIDRRDYLVERFGISWAIGPTPTAYTFVVAEELGPYRNELARFRTALTGWLSIMAILMLLALLLAVRWGLAPLRGVAKELSAMERGNAERISGQYPEELRALTDNLNALLARERARRKRLDDALGDLAHSLKTPLAVMRGALPKIDQASDQTAGLMEEQLTRMEHIVAHQLQRARVGSGVTPALAAPVPVARTAERIGETLKRVYAEKADIRFSVDSNGKAFFRGSEGDLMEVLGNLLDNAFKWTETRVRISIGHQNDLDILVEDDGPGVPADLAEQVLKRGTRGDEATPGQGIGLAITRDICEAYSGTLTIGRSPLGGALVRVRLPG